MPAAIAPKHILGMFRLFIQERLVLLGKQSIEQLHHCKQMITLQLALNTIPNSHFTVAHAWILCEYRKNICNALIGFYFGTAVSTAESNSVRV